MRAWWDDVRFAGRRLMQQPGFTAVAVITLALGIGANTAIFTLIHAVMLRSLPVSRPAELYRLGNGNNCCVNTGLQTEYSLFSHDAFRHLQSQLTEFSDLAAFQANVAVTPVRPPDGGAAVAVPAAFVSGNYFRMLGVLPSAGRLLEPGDDVPGAPLAMVMSYRTWVEQFGADAALVGRSFPISGTSITLVGVAARDFFGETVRPNPAGLWLPLGQEPVIRGPAASIAGRPNLDWLYAIGRVAPGTDAAAIGGRASHALRAWLTAQSFLSERERTQVADQRIVVTPAAAGVQLMRGNFGQSLTLLFAMSGLVLLIAAANLANLLLARADRAQAAIRAALGASAGRLVRQSLLEGLLLSLVGCAGAFLVSVLATRAIVSLAFPPETTLPIELVPSPVIVLFAIALALVTGTLFAAAPAWAMARTPPIDALRGVAREGADRSFVPRRSLVVIQVVLSLVLLAGAGLLVKSLRQLEEQPLGFEPEHRLIVRIDPPALASEPERLAGMYSAMQLRLEQVPGVVRASYSLYGPMEGNNWSSGIAIAGRPFDPARRDSSSWNRVGPGYFETTGTRVVRGRGITAGDTPGSQHVAVVNQTFAQRFFGAADPIGGQFGIGDASHSTDYTIVGVVEDVKYTNAHLPARPMAFLPVMQLAKYATADDGQAQTRSTMIRSVAVQVAPGANVEPAIRRAIAEVHPDLTVTRVLTLERQVSGNFRNNRLLAALAAAYGVLAFALASLGLYGVTSYGVSRRLHEIGVRMALGAGRGRIIGDVLRAALTQAAVGLLLGVPLALAAGGLLTTQLFNVNSRDPFIIGSAALALLLTAALAAAWPARRAASVEPSRALRPRG